MDKLREKIIGSAKKEDGKLFLPCAKAFAISAEYNVTPKEIGDICNEENIRICTCQLGCF